MRQHQPQQSTMHPRPSNLSRAAAGLSDTAALRRKAFARWSVCFVLLAITFQLALSAQTNSPARGMVSSAHPLATDAGLKVLKSGGNAIDAAVAVGLTLGVVDTHNSGIGGGCFLLIRTATGSFAALDGREKAPAAASRDMFVRNGKADPALSQTGALAANHRRSRES